MYVYFDTEFSSISDELTGELTIQPLSVGLTVPDAHEDFYVEIDCDLNTVAREAMFQRGDHWLTDNVISKLRSPGVEVVHPSDFKTKLDRFLGRFKGNLRLVAYNPHVDMVVLKHLYGGKIKRFKNPVLDLRTQVFQQKFDLAKVPNYDRHHALSDAEWNHDLHRALRSHRNKGV